MPNPQTLTWWRSVAKSPEFAEIRSHVLESLALPVEFDIGKGGVAPDVLASFALRQAHSSGVAAAIRLLDRLATEPNLPPKPLQEWSGQKPIP